MKPGLFNIRNFVRLLQVEEKETIFVQATLTTTRLINMSNSTHLVNVEDLNTAVWTSVEVEGRTHEHEFLIEN